MPDNRTGHEDATDDVIPPEFLKAPYVGQCSICKSKNIPSPMQEALCAYFSCEGHCKEYHYHMRYHIRWDGQRVAGTGIVHSDYCTCVVCTSKTIKEVKEPSVPKFGAVEETEADFPVDKGWLARTSDSGSISLPKELGGIDS